MLPGVIISKQNLTGGQNIPRKILPTSSPEFAKRAFDIERHQATPH